jgi:hypothetical protein
MLRPIPRTSLRGLAQAATTGHIQFVHSGRPGDDNSVFLLALLPSIHTSPWRVVGDVPKTACFAMIATTIWLLNAVANPLVAMVALLGVSLVCVFRNFTSALVATSLLVATFTFKPADYVEFHPAFLEGDRVTIVEFSTPLCLTCDLNSLVLDTYSVRSAVAQHNVQILHADVSKDAEATELLNELGYDSVPVLGIFRGTEPVLILPDLITASKVLAGIETASGYETLVLADSLERSSFTCSGIRSV